MQQLQMLSQPTLVAARLILVHGECQSDAIRETGCQAQHLLNIIDQAKQWIDIITLSPRDLGSEKIWDISTY